MRRIGAIAVLAIMIAGCDTATTTPIDLYGAFAVDEAGPRCVSRAKGAAWDERSLGAAQSGAIESVA